MLDNILEESVDQHFHALIQTRNLQRRRDIGDDSFSAEAIEEMGESNLEPLEVQIRLSTVVYCLTQAKLHFEKILMCISSLY